MHANGDGGCVDGAKLLWLVREEADAVHLSNLVLVEVRSIQRRVELALEDTVCVLAIVALVELVAGDTTVGVAMQGRSPMQRPEKTSASY